MPSQISPQIKLGVWVLIILSLVIVSGALLKGPVNSAKGSVLGISFPAGMFNFTSNFSFMFETQSSGLSKVVGERLAGADGEYAVYIEDLSDGENYGLKQYDSFPSASLYKVFLMAAVLKKVENGELTLDSKVSSTKKHLASVLGSVDFGYEEAPEEISYTIQIALERVGRISDNFASLMLAEKVSWDQVQEVVDSIGTTNTIIKSPIRTSAADVGLFFKKLHQKEVVSPKVSEQIMEFLSLNNINDRIPAKLPEGVKTVHKTGELSRLRHDAGLVYFAYSTTGYVIVLMSKDLQYEDQGIEVLANLSKDVYDYLKSKQKI